MTQFIQYQEYKISVSMVGKGEVILFLHGWPTNSRLWQSQIAVLEDNYKVITLDWLGFGKSDKPENFKYTFTKKKEILNTVIQSLCHKNEKITIVAHDIGGPPAILWASENEDRVSRLILLNTVVYTLSTPLDKLSHIGFNIPLLNDVLMSNFGLRQIMHTNTSSGSVVTKQSIREILSVDKSIPKSVKLNTILNPMNVGRKNEIIGLSEKYKQLNIQKYLIIAKKDPLCFAHIDRLRSENPEVLVFYIPDCGHYMPIDQPDALNKILISIFNNNS